MIKKYNEFKKLNEKKEDNEKKESPKKEKSYEADEMDKICDTQDWDYKVSVKFTGTKASTKTLSITKEQFEKIKKIIAKG